MDKTTNTLVQLALLPFALAGLLLMGTCGLFCVAMVNTADETVQANE
jgi:hypothetical protein